jgi:uncharacterized protein DUF1844
MDDEQPKGFQVRDRRRFTETGDVREDADADRPSEAPPKAEEPAPSAPRAAAEPRDVPLEITLSTFVMSLSTQALMCLGEIPNPVTGKREVELPAVQELIDIIAMLQERTRGNVDPSEVRLFETVLYDLRLRYVEKARK